MNAPYFIQKYRAEGGMLAADPATLDGTDANVYIYSRSVTDSRPSKL